MDKRTDDLLARLQISDIADRRPSEVSGGERQRAVLAQALAKRPVLLFADEPTSNLDPAATALVAAILDEHCRAGMACVVSTHNVPAFAAVATRQARIVAGRVLGSSAQPAP
jgi:energy-coupling factor transporter ATP-binding protein EcfA2